MNPARIPLCVDLDGTLCRSDTLFECLLLTLKREPVRLLQLPAWLLRGRATLKQELAAGADLDPERLPYHKEFVEWLRAERERGRELVLCTAADRSVAQAVADHLGLFSSVIASDGTHNLRGEAKRAELVRRYGERGYDYAGNDTTDFAVWSSARQSVVVSASNAVAARATDLAPTERRFAAASAGLLTWLKALRVHQWSKNLLVLVPFVLAYKFNIGSLEAALMAFLAFSLCASSVYLLNDLLDLAADRAHPRKRRRPFARGALPLSHGLLMSALLLAAAFTLAAWLPPRFFMVLGFYYAVTLAYSLHLKRVATIDVMLLAGLYTLRLVAGGAATLTPLSFWLLAFSMFIFLSLAVIKRYTELWQSKEGGNGKPAGRGYHADDLPMIGALGVAAGYSAVLVLALYVNSPQAKAYADSKWLWLLCPLLLYWISRAWMLAHRGRMTDDPLVFALTDRVSLFIGLLMTMVVAAAF